MVTRIRPKWRNCHKRLPRFFPANNSMSLQALFFEGKPIRHMNPAFTVVLLIFGPTQFGAVRFLIGRKHVDFSVGASVHQIRPEMN